jgi:hypothetical protein
MLQAASLDSAQQAEGSQNSGCYCQQAKLKLIWLGIESIVQQYRKGSLAGLVEKSPHGKLETQSDSIEEHEIDALLLPE